MIGCFLLFAGAGFLTVMAVYMGTLIAYFVAFATTMAIYVSTFVGIFASYILLFFS
jgi:hypothetical protein